MAPIRCSTASSANGNCVCCICGRDIGIFLSSPYLSLPLGGPTWSVEDDDGSVDFYDDATLLRMTPEGWKIMTPEDTLAADLQNLPNNVLPCHSYCHELMIKIHRYEDGIQLTQRQINNLLGELMLYVYRYFRAGGTFATQAMFEKSQAIIGAGTRNFVISEDDIKEGVIAPSDYVNSQLRLRHVHFTGMMEAIRLVPFETTKKDIGRLSRLPIEILKLIVNDFLPIQDRGNLAEAAPYIVEICNDRDWYSKDFDNNPLLAGLDHTCILNHFVNEAPGDNWSLIQEREYQMQQKKPLPNSWWPAHCEQHVACLVGSLLQFSIAQAARDKLFFIGALSQYHKTSSHKFAPSSFDLSEYDLMENVSFEEYVIVQGVNSEWETVKEYMTRQLMYQELIPKPVCRSPVNEGYKENPNKLSIWLQPTPSLKDSGMAVQNEPDEFHAWNEGATKCQSIVRLPRGFTDVVSMTFFFRSLECTRSRLLTRIEDAAKYDPPEVGERQHLTGIRISTADEDFELGYCRTAHVGYGIPLKDFVKTTPKLRKGWVFSGIGFRCIREGHVSQVIVESLSEDGDDYDKWYSNDDPEVDHVRAPRKWMTLPGVGPLAMSLICSPLCRFLNVEMWQKRSP